METLASAASLVGFIALVAFIWLLVVAFKRSFLWGVLVFLLSPITATIFAAKYWREAQKPFLVYIVTVTLSFAYVGLMYDHMGISDMFKMQAKMESGEFTEEDAFRFMENTMDRMETSGQLDEQEQQDLAEMRGIYQLIKQDTSQPQAPTSRITPREPEPELRRETQQTRPYERQQPTYQDVAISELATFINKPLKVFDRQGREHQVTLLGMQADRLNLRKSLSGGSFDFDMPTAEIDRVQALKQI